MTGGLNTRRGSVGSRPNSRKIVLFVDGRTEQRYFQRFKQRGSRSSLRVLDCHSFIHNVRKITEQQFFTSECGRDDIVAVVTDKDANSAEVLLDLEREFRKVGVSFFVSNPSFEVWLLLHYRIPRGDVSQKGLEDMLTAALGRKYVKGAGIPDDVDPHAAIANAEMLLPDADTESCLRRSPSTTVHQLVKSMIGSA